METRKVMEDFVAALLWINQGKGEAGKGRN